MTVLRGRITQQTSSAESVEMLVTWPVIVLTGRGVLAGVVMVLVTDQQVALVVVMLSTRSTR
jgi:hypothetical protein